MIKPSQRLFCPDGSLGFEPDELSTWNFVDFDTRKWLVFEGPTDPFGYDDGQKATEALLPVLDKLPNSVTKVTFSADGKHWKATNSSDDDITPIVDYPDFGKEEVGDYAKQTIKRGNWVEIDRLGPCLDLISITRANRKDLFVYKYNIVQRPRAMRTIWSSAFIHRAVSTHPNVVPFGDFVVHEITGQYLGYTTRFIPGGSLDTRKPPVFKSKWVKQLTNLVDYLNLTRGVLHQDIVPRNMVLHDTKDRILLFDFEYAAFVGSEYIIPMCDDVADLCFSIYEILTGDRQYDAKRRNRKLNSIMKSTKHWPLKQGIQLERGIAIKEIKAYLNSWVKTRKELCLPMRSELKDPVHVPERKVTPVMSTDFNDDGTLCTAPYVTMAEPNAYIIRWERPASVHQGRRRSPRLQG